MARTPSTFALLSVAALLACSRSPAEPSPAPSPAASPAPNVATNVLPPRAAPPVLQPAPSGAASAPSGSLPLAWDDPARWQRHPPSSQMRAAEYLVPHASGDTEDAECTVVTFGAGMGGSTDDNVDRWAKQFDGAPSPSRTIRTAHGMKVTRVEMTGTYHGMRMPGAPPAGPHAGWRLVGEIVEAPSGAWFFKLTGPDATVKAAAKELDAMVDSCRAAGATSAGAPSASGGSNGW